MLYERDTTYRQVYTDGRKLPVDPQRSWLGYPLVNGTAMLWLWIRLGSMTVVLHACAEDAR